MATVLARRASTTAKKPVLVTVDDLTGGLDRRVEPSLMKPDRARRLRNVRLSVEGEWQPRPGWLAWMDSLSNTRGQGAARIYLDGVSPFTLAAFEGLVYKPTDGGTRGAAVLTGLSTSDPIFFVYDPVLVAAFDGTNVPKKSLDGSTWTQFGVSPPSAPTLAAIAGGSLITSHTYEVSYAYRSGLTTSNEGATATQAVSGANLTVRVTMALSADPQVTDLDVYARNVTAGEGIRRYAGTVANTGSPVLNITANTWSAEEEAPTGRTVPVALAFGFVWKNRWWAIDANDRTILRFSELFEPQSWPANYYIEVPFTRGDRVAGGMPFGDTLILFGQSKQVFIITASTSLDFDVRPSEAAEAGCFGPRALDGIEGGILHAGAEGVYLFNGAADRWLTADFDLDWRAMVAASSEATLSKIALCAHRRDKEVRIAVPVLPVYGAAGEFVLDLARSTQRPVWSTTDRALGGYVPWDGVEATTGSRGRLFAWADTDGVMTEESVGAAANGADLIADYEGPVFSTGYQMARFLQLHLDVQPADGTFALTVKCDGRTVLQTSIDITGGVARYGSALYGTSTYGGGSRVTIPIELPLEAEGALFQLIAQYAGQAVSFKWFGYGFTAKPEPEIRGF